jgi:hypothetical protein
MKMARKKRDELKSLIQKVERDKPPLNFTDLVMEEVEAQESVINPDLKVLLKRNGIENLSPDFTHRIMTQVEARDFHTRDKPIITKKAWLIIISAILVFVLYLSFSEQTSKPPGGGLTPYFINIGNTLNIILTNVYSIPALYLVTFISISTLLIMDYLLRTKGQGHEAKSRASL